MGKVNILLKRSFICVISVNATLGILLLGFTLFGHGALHSHEQEEMTIFGLHFMYGFSVIMIIFPIIGGFGLWKRKKWVLIVFIVGMILICLYFTGSAIFALATLSQMDLYMKEQYLSMLPLSNFNQSDLEELHNAQRELHCCGLMSFKDWEGNLPESCLCVTDSPDTCVDVSTSDGSLQNVFNTNHTRIYEKPCISVLVQHDLHYLHTLLGIMFGFVLLWILSIGLCIAILCQLNKKMDTPKVFFSPQAKAGNYSNLNDAALDA